MVGMLAIHPAPRGHRLSLILGAHGLLDIETRFEFWAFMAGVKKGNAQSFQSSPGSDCRAGFLQPWHAPIRWRWPAAGCPDSNFGIVAN
jgi:hypothetical protein